MVVKKIKIIDNDEIRNQIGCIYEKQNEILLAKWSLELAKHIIKIANLDVNEWREVSEGFRINELWQKKQVSIMMLGK